MCIDTCCEMAPTPSTPHAKYKRQQLTAETAIQQAATEPLHNQQNVLVSRTIVKSCRHGNLFESQCHCLQKGNAKPALQFCNCSPGKVTVRDPFVEGGGGLVGDPNDRAVGGAEALPRPVLGLGLHVGSDALHLGWGSCRTASLTFTQPKGCSPTQIRHHFV